MYMVGLNESMLPFLNSATLTWTLSWSAVVPSPQEREKTTPMTAISARRMIFITLKCLFANSVIFILSQKITPSIASAMASRLKITISPEK